MNIMIIVREKTTGAMYAMKEVNKKYEESIRNEIAIMKSLSSCEFIAKLHEVISQVMLKLIVGELYTTCNGILSW